MSGLYNHYAKYSDVEIEAAITNITGDKAYFDKNSHKHGLFVQQCVAARQVLSDRQAPRDQAQETERRVADEKAIAAGQRKLREELGEREDRRQQRQDLAAELGGVHETPEQRIERLQRQVERARTQA